MEDIDVNKASVNRPVGLALATMAVLMAAVAALALGRGHDAQASDMTAHMNQMHMTTQSISTKELRLRRDMRKLWEDHITWTRLAIISLTTGSADTQATVARLLRNQVDIGNAIKPFYGRTAGNQLTQLLRQHILIAADVVAAAKAGDQAKLADAQARWTANADEIAGFLARANPRAWKVAEMKSMMREHLKLTTNEAVARLTGNWAADVAAYDAIHRQALNMADMLSSGIVKQFPRRVR
jgi:hypothetical protein